MKFSSDIERGDSVNLEPPWLHFMRVREFFRTHPLLFVNSSELIFFLFGEWNSSEPILVFPAIKDDLSGIWRNCFPLVLELTGFKKNL